MKYAIVDLKIADVILPSFYQIDIIIMNRYTAIDRYSFLVNPDSDLDKRMYDKYKNDFMGDINDFPRISTYWTEIYLALTGVPVLMYKADYKAEAILLKSIADYLTPPTFKYLDVYSMIRNIWELPTKNSNLENYGKLMQIDKNERIEVLQEMIIKLIEKTEAKTINELKFSTQAKFGYCYDGEIIKGKDLSPEEVEKYDEKTIINSFNYNLISDKWMSKKK